MRKKNQPLLTKKDLFNRLLTNEIQIMHPLREDIKEKKKLKCFVHGSQRVFSAKRKLSSRFETLIEGPQSKNNQNMVSAIIQNGFIEAPCVIGKKSHFEQKDAWETNYRSHKSNNYPLFSNRNLRSCCTLRQNFRPQTVLVFRSKSRQSLIERHRLNQPQNQENVDTKGIIQQNTMASTEKSTQSRKLQTTPRLSIIKVGSTRANYISERSSASSHHSFRRSQVKFSIKRMQMES